MSFDDDKGSWNYCTDKPNPGEKEREFREKKETEHDADHTDKGKEYRKEWDPRSNSNSLFCANSEKTDRNSNRK